jgi:hypothetical protein
MTQDVKDIVLQEKRIRVVSDLITRRYPIPAKAINSKFSDELGCQVYYRYTIAPGIGYKKPILWAGKQLVWLRD